MHDAMTSPRGRPRTPRRGFTLPELLIVMVMMAVVGGTLVSVLNGQQRFASATSDAGNTRMQIQTAAAVLPADLRSVSPIGGDIISMSASSIAIRSTIATSVVCQVAGNDVTLAPATNGPTSFTHVSMAPIPGDSVFIWFDNDPALIGDDTWGTVANPALPYGITEVVTVNGACPGIFAPAGNTAPALVLTIENPRAFAVGAPLRVTRATTYGLYQSSADGQWYLGLKSQNEADHQYLAGPFQAQSATAGESGLELQYFDAAGNAITNYALTQQVGRVAITVRAQRRLNGTGMSTSHPMKDSLQIGVSFRNRN